MHVTIDWFIVSRYGFLVNPLQWFEASVYYNNWPCYGLLLGEWSPLVCLQLQLLSSFGCQLFHCLTGPFC